MKSLLVLLYCLFIMDIPATNAYGQPDPLLKQMALALEDQFTDPDRRGKRLKLRVSLTADRVLESSGDSAATRIGMTISEMFGQFAEHMDTLLDYEVSLYWDVLSDRQFAMVRTVRKPLPGEERVVTHVGHNELPPYLTGGLDRFIRSLYEDLQSHAARLEQLPAEIWGKPLKFVLDSQCNFSVLPHHELSGFLSESLNQRWKPAIYNGSVPPIMISCRVYRDVALSVDQYDWRKHDFDFSYSHLLTQRFKDRWIAIEGRDYVGILPSRKKILVSMVYDPMTTDLRAPLIHSGCVSEAQELIDWLHQQSIPVSRFDADTAGRPQLKRTFFFVVGPESINAMDLSSTTMRTVE